jgi:PAS domain S-box-containing protein
LEPTNISSADDRLEKITALLIKYSTGDFSARETISPKGDNLDAIIIGLNTLAEEIQASGKVIRNYEKRVENLMNVLLKYTLFDFSEKAETTENGDEIDAIAIGLNTLAEELVSARETEEKQLDAITKSNHFLDTILENVPLMIFVKDAKELRFIRFNKAGEELLGYPREDLMGKNDYDFFPKEQADFFTQKDREALDQKTITDIPEELIDTANGQRWLHTRKIPIHDENGNAIYLLGISEDITRRKGNELKIKSLNEELMKNIAQLEASNSELESFTYSVSHDLRAPLRAIHGYTNIIETEYASLLNSDAKDMMKSIMSNAKRMGQLIDDLLSLSRLGKKELSKKKVNMTELAKQSLEELKKSLGAVKAQIEIKDLGEAMVDNNLMFQVFVNLLSNAVKYSSRKEQAIVEVGTKSDGPETIYYVKDNGTGFDMKYYDKLFGVFQRLHSNEEFEGTGVGLALVKRIVGKHGGKVWAESVPGEGATFYFSLNNS